MSIIHYRAVVTACALFIAVALSIPGVAQSLPRATPEVEGVSSEGLLAFLDAFDDTEHELHSVMLLRHGKVVAEGWWAPYGAELTHTMYSASKTFTATAIGIAAGEGLLTVDDAVVSFFPDQLPDPMPPHLADLTVKHLLTMTVGHDPDPTRAIVGAHDDWVKAFLATGIVEEPGSTFLYNSMATYMLSAIVTKVTGHTVLDYLTPRLFEPLGITGIDWETDPEGINTGGWGLRLHTEDMAKLGQLYLHDGLWNGTRLLPGGWVAEATTAHILQNPDVPDDERAKSDWMQGYGYQIWRCRHDAYRGDGAFGQYIVVMPEKDAVLAITSQTPNMQGVLDIAWEHLLPALKDEALPANLQGATALREHLANLALPAPEGNASQKNERLFADKTFALDANERTIASIGFAFEDDTCQVTLNDDKGTYTIPANAGEWAYAETKRHGPYLVARAKNSLMGLPPFKIAAAYRWLDDGALELTLRYYESPHTETLTCRVEGDRIEIGVVTGVQPSSESEGVLVR